MSSETPAPSKKENIKSLFAKIPRSCKRDFYESYSEAFGVSSYTASSNHFSRFWNFGGIDLDKVIVFMQNYIANKNLNNE